VPATPNRSETLDAQPRRQVLGPHGELLEGAMKPVDGALGPELISSRRCNTHPWVCDLLD
jgi:hypothetical protein